MIMKSYTPVDEHKYMSFLVKGKELLKKYNGIWDKADNIIKKGFDNEPEFNVKYSKTKIKSYKGKVNTTFHNDKMLKQGSHYICLSVVLIDFDLKMGKNYYTQVIWE